MENQLCGKNHLHKIIYTPEGNGRALRIFLWFLGNQAGWELRFESMEPAEWLTACVAAHNGDYSPLITLLSPIVDQLEE